GRGHHERPAQTTTAEHRVYDQLRARPLDHVRGVHVRVPDELVPVADEQVDGGFVATPADVQHDVLGERVDAVGVAGRAGQFQHLGDLARRQVAEPVYRRGGGHPITVAVTG